MDVLQNRKILGGLGLSVAFGLLIAWMVPPTEPKPPAPNWRAQIKPTAPPAPVEFAGFAPMAAMPAYPVERYASAGSGSYGDEDVAIHRGRSSADAIPVAEAPDARADAPAPVDGPPSRGDGNRWADRRAVTGARICDAAPNEAVAQGCRAYYGAARAETASYDPPDGPAQEDADY